MKVWLISDTHFGHENIYKFVGFDKVTRIRERFDNAREGDAYMFDRWNDLVRPEDHIYHLGDVAMSMAPYVHRIRSLPGHKRLILGNHDKDPMKVYADAGFQKIMSVRMWDRKVVILTHMPIHEDGLSHSKANIHGHIHQRVMKDPRYVNVSVERTNYEPVELESILAGLDT